MLEGDEGQRYKLEANTVKERGSVEGWRLMQRRLGVRKAAAKFKTGN